MTTPISPEKLGTLVKDMVFGTDAKTKQYQIRDLASANGLFFASIHNLYREIGKGYMGFTVPAMNLRGITYDVARAVFRAAMKNEVGAFVFEIARSEIEYTKQTPGEFGAAIIAAGLAEGYKGPVFLQGDHFQVRRKLYRETPDQELNAIKNLIQEAVNAGFYNIDIDASTLVDIDKPSLLDQQAVNGRITAEMTKFIRSIEPEGITISIGGEIGEIGSSNSTAGDLRAYMQQFIRYLGEGIEGISKISIQTGTTHGGIVLPDGSIAKVQLDFDTLENLSNLARSEYGMGGVVQHGASTLPDEMFDLFPKKGTLEVHLATGFQNIIFDSSSFPKELLARTQAAMDTKYAGDKKPGETSTQFYYRNRKRIFGDFKKELWSLPRENLQNIMQELEERFTLIFHKLNVTDTRNIIDKLILHN
jgi:fructose/tagatose bisphosphate aldolase